MMTNISCRQNYFELECFERSVYVVQGTVKEIAGHPADATGLQLLSRHTGSRVGQGRPGPGLV